MPASTAGSGRRGGRFFCLDAGDQKEWSHGLLHKLEARRMLEAKLACRLEKYSRVFPEQMEIYLEDDKCVIYKFKQDTFMLNNFAIDYGYNETSDMDYYEQLRARMLKREQDVTEVGKKLSQLRAEDE